MQQALAVLNQMQSAGGIIGTGEISNAARQAALASDSLIFNLALVSLVFCWILGIVDAYRIGKKIDREVPSAGTLPQDSRR
ncbi:MAG: hypothetical protein O8C63_12660 [Candidatus Methanoperedens sp.]|nr:hypothetical protein [Candidatus Methanoperedens sp.]